MTNSADQDQKPTDLALHYLQRQGISESSRTKVNIFSYLAEHFIFQNYGYNKYTLER